VERDVASGTFAAPALAIDRTDGNSHDASLTGDEHYVVFSRKVGGVDQIWEATR
jgi:hypothetical protein